MDNLLASIGRAIEAMPPTLSAVIIVILAVGFLAFAARREAKANEAKKASESASLISQVGLVSRGVTDIQADLDEALDALRRLEGSVEILKDRVQR